MIHFHRKSAKALSMLAGLFCTFLWIAEALAQTDETPSGLPVPRFVSLGDDSVNVRNGPGIDHRILWKYQNGEDLPVEIIAETEQWRRIRDSEGNEGWVYAPLLDGKRFLLVQGDGTDKLVPLRSAPGEGSPVNILAQPGVLGRLVQCQDDWCYIRHDAGNGWVHRSLVWGVYPGEIVN